MLNRRQQNPSFRDNVRTVGFWPLLALILIAVLWAVIESKLASDKENVLRDAFERASSLTTAYAEQTARTIEEIDRATLLTRHLWIETDGELRLDDYFKRGIFPTTLFNVSIGNANGDVVTSTFDLPSPLNFGNRDWFQAHRADRRLGLLISPPEVGARTGRTIVRFSRRIEDDKGVFKGVAWVTVEPPYLTAFYGGHQLNKDEFISVRILGGPLLSSKVGGSDGAPRIFYREHPVFNDAKGVIEEPAEKFHDGVQRFVAWEKLSKYPVVALSGLKEESVFSAHSVAAAAVRAAAIIGTLLLMALGAVGAYYSLRLAQRKQQAREVKNTYRLAVDAAQEGFYMLRPVYDTNRYILDFRVEDCNERAAAFIGRSRSEVIGRAFSEIIPPEYQGDTSRILRRVMEIGFHEEEFRVPGNPPGRPSWLYRRFMKSESGVAMVVRDISHTKAHEQELLQIANTDPLTSLPNRHWLGNFLPVALERSGKSTKKLALLFIDLDDFKNINDTLGHDAGDELLQAVAVRLESAVRASDHVVRLGGDEFTIILEHFETTDDVAHVAGQIVQSLGEPYTIKGMPGQRVHASIGISVFPDDGQDEETLLKHADIAMYAAKEGGKGRYHFYQPHLSDTLVLRLSKEQALRNAVERDEFVVHFQPRVGVKSGLVRSMEALVRWRHPERGLVYPTEFIDIAEDTDLIVGLGELVIEKVCMQLAAWKRQGVDVVPVSINVSPQQLKRGHVSSFIADCLKRHRVEARLIEVELTESAVIDRSKVVSNELRELRALGVKLMIDDFGTGHSSLAQLHRLDVDVLKVDKAFTDALCTGAEGRVLFQAIVSMADALDMCVVAEGVETTEQFRILDEIECDEVQGHIFSKALSADEMSGFMFEHSRRQRMDVPVRRLQ